MRIYCFGNEAIEEDSMAKKACKDLEIEGVDFVLCDSAEELLDKEHKDQIVIVDVVKFLDKVTLFEGIDQLKEHKLISGHDFDLGFQLKLLKAIGELKKVKIIGVPQEGDVEEIKENIKRIISSLNSSLRNE